MIDLHLHTTASDGLFSPTTLVDFAWRAGIRTMSVTDHDTVAGLPEARTAATAAGMTFVPGIEITAVHEGRDIHVLGYFFDPEDAELSAFLTRARADRARRLGEIADKLSALGRAIDVEALIAAQAPGASLARPLVAKALVKAGHVADVREAFEQLLGEGKPAYVSRSGPGPRDVIAIIHRAGGIASLAHPGVLKRDELIPDMIAAGLTAVEVFHSDHDEATTQRYLALATAHRLLVTGGSDYHGDKERRRAAFGNVGLPADHFERLQARLTARD